ncbi:MAG: GDSL-type esterase/lipase family protein [Galactobacter sp.]
METRSVRLVAIGDELLAGHGDPRGLGWFGRVLARTPGDQVQLEPYVLASPKETTEELAGRWLGEAQQRFNPDGANRVVVALSAADEEQGISTARSRLNLANILDAATQLSLSAFVVGPPPTLDPARNQRISQLSTAFGDVTTRRNHFYVDTFTPLEGHEQFRTDLAAHWGVPSQQGHGLLAWLVLHRGWYPWLGITEPEE